MFVLLIRTVVMFLIVIVLIKIMGRRTIGELQVSELVVTLLISNIAAVPMQETGVPLFSGAIPVATLVVMELVISASMLKFPKFNKLVNGAPIAVIKEGRIDRSALRKLRMTAEDLFQSLRKKDIFDITTVAYAIVESDGTLSALQYSKSVPPSAEDMKLKASRERLNVLLVCDGSIDESSMKFLGLSEAKVHKIMNKNGIDPDDVFIMTADTEGRFELLEKKEGK